ncbi:MAG: TatD family hydrolase [Lachnospiraceae bacterium]|nr:TatD family hydrolase [Lachnospiraceae bacterium]
MIFDTHAHYDDEAFDNDREELFGKMQEAGIQYVTNIGANMETSQNTVKLCETYPFVYGAVGIHPNDAEEVNDENIEELRQMSRKDKIVAIGEIGLDYYWPEPSKEIQKKGLEAQVALAKSEKLPIVVHSRDAARDTADMLGSLHAGDCGGVIHCFSYTKEMAREFLNMGFYIGVGGVVTFKNARKLKEAVAYIPMERIVLETDCPYLAPVPYRGKRNSSFYLPHVVEEIAGIKNISYEDVLAQTMSNAKKMYKIQ